MIYSNDTLMDRLTVDLFTEFYHTNRHLKVYDVEPYVSGNLQTFPADPIIDWPITNDLIRLINGRKYIEFNSPSILGVNTTRPKTAMRWFVVENYNGDFLYGARVGSFLHGLPLNTERLIVKPGDLQELYTFQMRFEMDEGDDESLNYSREYASFVDNLLVSPWEFTPTYYYSKGVDHGPAGFPADYDPAIHGDAIWMLDKTSNSIGWLGTEFISNTATINLQFSADNIIKQIWVNGVQISDGTATEDSSWSLWSNYTATVTPGETSYISIQVQDLGSAYGFVGRIYDDTNTPVVKTSTSWVTG